MLVNDLLANIMTGWQEAASQVIVPEEPAIPPADRTPEQIAESAAKGRELFYGAPRATACKCHGPTGLGDGQQTDFDNWSKANKEFIDKTDNLVLEIQELKQRLPELEGDERTEGGRGINADGHRAGRSGASWSRTLLPPRNAIPRNLRDGIYRGGRRPVDIFWRVSAGIAGTPMPAGGPATEGGQARLRKKKFGKLSTMFIRCRLNQPASRRRRPTNVEAVN